MTTQEIHDRLNHRAGKTIPIKHLMTLMERFQEITGQPVSDTNIEAFLQYAWWRLGKLFGKKFAKPPKLWAYLHQISKTTTFVCFQKLYSGSKIEICMKVNIQLITASVLSFGGLVLLFCGVFIDPEGQIHESLLVAFGEVATFSGALMGIDYVYKKRS